MLDCTAYDARYLKVAIGICTYNRPAGLKALLTAVDKQRLALLTDQQIAVIVIDNSTSGAAKDVCSGYASGGRFKLYSLNERRKGLAFARNAAIAAAREAEATHLAFVDDDELPHAEWLEHLLRGIGRASAAAAIGPVYPIFEAPPPAWLPPTAFVTRRKQRGGFVDDGYTCNCIVGMSAIAHLNLEFSMRFNETGGEDTFFFKRLIDEGGRIAWSENAIIYEVVPRHRMSTRWLWQRWYRTGTLEAELCRYDPASLQGRLFNLGRGFARLSAGVVRVVAGGALAILGRPSEFVASCYTLCRGAGLIAKVFGRDYKEYSLPTYR